MKALFYLGLVVLVLFEVMRIYFIMPMPGSQTMNSLDLAYFLHKSRWIFRIGLALLIILGAIRVFRGRRKWIPVVLLLICSGVIYLANFVMKADRMFLQPETLTMLPQAENEVPGNSIVIGVTNNGESKAYPIRYMAYHHQVQDVVGGQPMIITYCNVCRSGRVFEPIVRGKHESFRLVGMDHFNAMFEDATTKSWWRQATGEAVTGKLKGEKLPEVECSQMTLDKWFTLYPNALVMQPDQASLSRYDTAGIFEQGKSKSHLTRTDTASWKDKSWVVGIQIGDASKAYDWNRLETERVINDVVGGEAIVLVLSDDGKSFAAYKHPTVFTGEYKWLSEFTIQNDTLFVDSTAYDFSGISLSPDEVALKRVNAYQEFWHSWKQFHPQTETYE